jgi:cytochrome bd-type quinol oxidase subunit 2
MQLEGGRSKGETMSQMTSYFLFLILPGLLLVAVLAMPGTDHLKKRGQRSLPLLLLFTLLGLVPGPLLCYLLTQSVEATFILSPWAAVIGARLGLGLGRIVGDLRPQPEPAL